MKKTLYLLPLLITAILTLSCQKDEPTVPENGGHGEGATEHVTKSVRNQEYYSLGVSYDITKGHLDLDATRYPVINLGSFFEDYDENERYIRNPGTRGDDAFYAGANAVSFSQDIIKKWNTDNNVEGTLIIEEILSLGGHINYANESGSKNKQTTKYSYARAELIKRNKKVEIRATPEELIPYLFPLFLDHVNTYTPERLVREYGTHVLLGVTMGGRMQMDYRSQINETNDSTTKKNVVEAGINMTLFGVGLEMVGGYTHDRASETNKKNGYWESKITYLGGEGSGTSVEMTADGGYSKQTNNFHLWQSTVNDSNSTVIEIDWDLAYPIYEFITDPAKKQQVKAAVQQYISDNNMELIEVAPLYRMWAQSTLNNSFTTSEAERTHMKNNLYVDNNYTLNTNIMGYVFKTQQPGTVPLYRMWAQQIQNTSFTISEVERAHMKNNLYVDNNYTLNTNIMGYVFKTRQPGTVPLYRMWAQQTQNTSLTTSNVELNHMRNNLFVDNHMLTNFVQGYLLPNK